MAAFLTHDKHTVETTTNGRDGFETFKVGKFDAVVTDRYMPGMDSEQLSATI
jgi:DNA-binding response OmpR family regulator